jgi:GT2 family glycosyltransferase
MKCQGCRKSAAGCAAGCANCSELAAPVEWAIGITTAPRNEYTLSRTVNSLTAAGFDDWLVFAEPNSVLGEPVTISRVVQRPNTITDARFDVSASAGRFGVWRHYVQTLADLLAWKPNADAIMIVQDDVVFCRDLKPFLERELWPSDNVGVVSLWASSQYETERTELKRILDPHLIGALAYVFPRAVVEEMLTHEMSLDWRGAARAHATAIPEEKTACDAWVGVLLKKIRREVFYYTPSLAQHSAETSSIGNGSNTGFRGSLKFIGENTSAFSWVADPPRSPITRRTTGRGRHYPEYDEASKPTIQVAIPAVDSPKLTIDCLEHLAANDWPLHVNYLDNGSSLQTLDCVWSTLERLSIREGFKFTVHEFGANLGFTAANNVAVGIARENGQPLLMLNNDCNLGPNCLERLFRALDYNRKRAAAVGPITCDRGIQSLKHRRRLKQSGLRGIPKNTTAALERKLTNRTTTNESMLAFFCTLFQARALQDLGGLSPEFEDGLGADDEWCRRAIRRGYRLEVVSDAYADHRHSATFDALGIDRQAAQQVAKRRLIAR